MSLTRMNIRIARSIIPILTIAMLVAEMTLQNIPDMIFNHNSLASRRIDSVEQDCQRNCRRMNIAD